MNNRYFPSARTAIFAGLLFCAVANARVGASAGHAGKAPRSDLGIDSRTMMGVTLGESNLAEVQEKIGRTKLWTDGDASRAESKVCYITREPDAIVVVFASNVEMAGPPENSLTDIRVVRSAAYRQRSNCLLLAISGNDVATKNGLKIGLSRQQVKKILGAPEGMAGPKWKYSWSTDQLLPRSANNYQQWLSEKEECFEGQPPFSTIYSEIDARFDSDSVISFSLTRIESIC
jgi:hypothetical protein